MKNIFAITLIVISGIFAAAPEILTWKVETDSFKIVDKKVSFENIHSQLSYTDSIVTFDSIVTITGCKIVVYNPNTGKDTLLCGGTYAIGRWKHIDSTYNISMDTTTTITWDGLASYSCIDADGDSMGVFLNIRIGNDTVAVDSVWRTTTAFSGMFQKIGFRFHYRHKTWHDSTLACAQFSLDDRLLGYNKPPIILKQPQSAVGNLGSNVTFAIDAEANPAPVFQWYKNGIILDSDTMASLVINTVKQSDWAFYWVRISNRIGNIKSDTAWLSGLPVVSITPASQWKLVGDSVILSAAVTGFPAPVLQWQKDGLDLIDQNKVMLKMSSLTQADSGQYRVVATSRSGKDTSNVSILSVGIAPKVTIQPDSQYYKPGQTATFTATVIGYPIPVLQWQKNGVDIYSATSPSFNIASMAQADTGSYRVLARNLVGGDTSNIGKIQGVPPVASITSFRSTILGGTAFTCTASVSGVPLPTMQWQKNGVNIIGATGLIFLIPNASKSDSANYRVVVTNACGTVTTASIRLNVVSLLTMISIPSGSFRMGDST